MSHGPNVEGQGVGLLGRRRNGEGMPLKVGDGGDVQVDVVARLKGKVGRPLDDQVDDLRAPEGIVTRGSHLLNLLCAF